MASFSSLLSSISGAPQASPANSSKPPQQGQTNRAPNAASNGAIPAQTNAAAGVKRKAEDDRTAPNASKSIKTDPTWGAARPVQTSNPPSARPNTSATAPTSRFQLSARQSTSSRPNAPSPVKPAQRPPGTAPFQTPATPSNPTSSNPQAGAAKKRGFASIMEKAKAAQEAAKAAPSTIRHKPVERLSRRERLRREQQEAAGGKPNGKDGKLKPQGPQGGRSRSGTPSDTPHGKAGGRKREELGYKGTMKTAAPLTNVKKREPLAFKGTMRAGAVGAGGSGAAASKVPATAKEKDKRLAQDKYGGYASWSDLSDAEEEMDEQDDYGSESDDMEAGLDDVEMEELQSAKLAREADRKEQEELDRHAREKKEKKTRLEALAKQARGKKERY